MDLITLTVVAGTTGLFLLAIRFAGAGIMRPRLALTKDLEERYGILLNPAEAGKLNDAGAGSTVCTVELGDGTLRAVRFRRRTPSSALAAYTETAPGLWHELPAPSAAERI